MPPTYLAATVVATAEVIRGPGQDAENSEESDER
jgi:hypothetical protein